MTETVQTEIISIVYKPQHLDFVPPDRYSRTEIEQAHLLEGYGIEGDRKGGHPERNLNIISARTLESLAAEGFKTGPGEMGEQIILQGIDVEALPAGTLLRVGSMAVVEIVKLRTGCDRFEQIQGKSKAEAQGRLGVIAKVVHTGTIRKGDPVTVVQPNEVYV